MDEILWKTANFLGKLALVDTTRKITLVFSQEILRLESGVSVFFFFCFSIIFGITYFFATQRRMKGSWPAFRWWSLKAIRLLWTLKTWTWTMKPMSTKCVTCFQRVTYNAHNFWFCSMLCCPLRKDFWYTYNETKIFLTYLIVLQSYAV